MANLQLLSENLQAGKATEVKTLITKALDEGISATVILQDGLMTGMSIVGEKFKKNEIFIPEVLITARAMNAGMSVLKPYLIEEGLEPKGTAVIGTVKGDLHDIGKNMVSIMMEGKGIKIIDLGADVAPETFIDAAMDNGADFICCSALLTTTMNVMKDVIHAAEKAGVRNRFKIFIGGAPITQSYCDAIHADYYAKDAATAADVALSLLLAKGEKA